MCIRDRRPSVHKATFLWRTIYTFTLVQTSLQRPISSVPKVAVEAAGEVQLYETSSTFRGLLQAKCLGSWWRHSSFSPASSLRFHMKISLVFYKQSLIPSTDEIQITLTLNITQTVKTSVTVINIPIQDFLTWKIIYLLMVWRLGSNHSLFYFGYC